ncbi:hypothetical protein CEXT_798721 [Caerostris extrusa]|uniref:Uncharacterized protein n=1 Tax=Caerostris extrusa TaxID=172846 RepID=A0AAV4M8F9_CAEEX|nr:hypothetical protein CEXT_798721 [Caerostris extrusa]
MKLPDTFKFFILPSVFNLALFPSFQTSSSVGGVLTPPTWLQQPRRYSTKHRVLQTEAAENRIGDASRKQLGYGLRKSVAPGFSEGKFRIARVGFKAMCDILGVSLKNARCRFVSTWGPLQVYFY